VSAPDGKASEPSAPWLVVGLGNPGPDYAGNRHNLGFLVVDAIAERMGVRFKAAGGRIGNRAELAEGRISGPGSERVVLAKPRSYMNESGGPVAAVRAFFRVPLDRVVVVHDELDIDFGRIKVKAGGGDAGHNGLRSLRQAFGSGDYIRVRCGIGRPPTRVSGADWVLRDFAPAQRRELPLVIESAADAVEVVVRDGIDAAQRQFHGEPAG
jgi:PTH1 family peptidyl-tRNA hydrolase